MIKKAKLACCCVSLLLSSTIFISYGEDKKIFEEVVESDLIIDTDEQFPSEWTYKACLDRAIATNTDIRQTLLSILEADEDIASAKDAWLPTVDFSTNHGYTNYPVPGNGGKGNIYNSNYGVNASWTVWEGNARKYRLESAELIRRQQQFAGEDIMREIQIGILQAYLNILYSEEAINIAAKTLEVSTSQTERMRRLVESGRESKVSLAQIESQMAQDQYNLTKAQSDLATNKLNLKKLLVLGLEYDLNVVNIDFPDSEVNAPLPPMSETYLAATGWLPSLKSNSISSEIYANDVKIAKATSVPNISLQGGIGTGYTTGGRDWGYQMGHGLNENIGVSLSIPVYDGNKTKRAVAKARLASMEAEISRDQILNDLAQTIESLYIDAANARAKYNSGIVQLEAMDETSRLVDRQFELGLVNPLELLTAHNNLLNARLEQLQNKYMAILSAKTIEFYATRQVSLP